MPKGYWLIQYDITDADQYARYAESFRPVLARYGGQILVRWGRHEVTEGTARSRLVVFEFPDYAAALGAYHDPFFKRIHELRHAAAVSDVVIIEGYDAPSPSPTDRGVRRAP